MVDTLTNDIKRKQLVEEMKLPTGGRKMTSPIIDQAIKRLDGELNFADSHNYIVSKKKIRDILSSELQTAIDKTRKEERVFIGKTKREWYQRGFKEGRKSVVEEILPYIEHQKSCVRLTFHAGRLTVDGYEQQFGNKWYEATPIDRTPKCDCGLDKLLTTLTTNKEDK